MKPNKLEKISPNINALYSEDDNNNKDYIENEDFICVDNDEVVINVNNTDRAYKELGILKKFRSRRDSK